MVSGGRWWSNVGRCSGWNSAGGGRRSGQEIG